MISTEMKKKCDERRDQMAMDVSYQTWMADLKSTVNQHGRIQRDRMRTGNQIKVTKGGKAQKIPKGQVQYPMSAEQLDFNKQTYDRSIEEEDRMSTRLEKLVRASEVYTRYLSNVPGVGPSTAAVILSQFQPEKVYYVSNLWSFAGIVTGKDKLKKGEKAKFNTYLRAKLIGVMGANFVKQSSDYALYYYTKRIQLINRDIVLIEQGSMNPKIGTNTEGDLLGRPTAAHHSRMAIRHMVQRFVADYYVAFRTIHNIPVVPPYEEEYLDLKHVGTTFTSAETFLDHKKSKEERKATKDQIVDLRVKLHDLMILGGYVKANSSSEEDVELEDEEAVNSSIES